MTEDRRVGWHHRLDGHELEWTVKSCSPWGRKKSDMTDGTELNWGYCTGGSGLEWGSCVSIWKVKSILGDGGNCQSKKMWSNPLVKEIEARKSENCSQSWYMPGPS